MMSINSDVFLIVRKFHNTGLDWDKMTSIEQLLHTGKGLEAKDQPQQAI